MANSTTEANDALAALEEIENSPLGRAWLEAPPEVGAAPTATAEPWPMPGVIGPLPRRKRITYTQARTTLPPMIKNVEFDAPLLRTFSRLFVWLAGFLRFALGNLNDSMRGRDSVERRAVRLRRSMEKMGPTFIKIGQQLSIRADILPYEYCRELSKMQDSVPPFKVELAIARIEQLTGKKVTDLFAVFDPVPIGSASIACVFQAQLKNGEKVAVKVRRPGIGSVFASDLRALGWMFKLAEATSFIRPGMTGNLRVELGTMLREELNYWHEARFTELFRRGARKTDQRHLTAPKVYFELSGEDVLVTELVSGVFLREILEAMDRKDEAALQAIRDRGIDLPRLAKRMIRAFYYETAESILFHADPHPSNIVVRADNSLVFIDFGACGRFSSRSQRLYERLWACFDQEDIDGMVDNAISLVEPLPPIDLQRFRKEFEALFWEWVYASKSNHAEWWERCTGQLWMKFITISRRFSVPMSLDALRLFRATFLYDSIAMRLWNDLDLNGEYAGYSRERGRRARQRIAKWTEHRLNYGPTALDYNRINDSTRFMRQLSSRVQYFLDTPDHQFAGMISKAAYGVSVALKVLVLGGGFHAVLILALGIIWSYLGQAAPIADIAEALVSHPVYRTFAVIVTLLFIRRILFRLTDVDVRKR